MALALLQTGTGPAVYAFTLGLVAALNPCGFPLLPAYLSLFAYEGGSGYVRQTARGLLTGASVTAGFVVIFGAFGIAVESGVQVLYRVVPWFMIPLGAALAIVGLRSAFGRQLHLPLPTLGIGNRRGIAAMAVFGAGYAIASLTCSLPLFLAGVAGSFTRLGMLDGIMTAVAYALGMGLFLMVTSLIVAWAGGPAIRRFNHLAKFVPRLAGIVLALVGSYLVYYWANYLNNPLSSPTPIRLVEQVQSALSGWLSAVPQMAGLILAAVVLASLGILALAQSAKSQGAAHFEKDQNPEPTERELQHER